MYDDIVILDVEITAQAHWRQTLAGWLCMATHKIEQQLGPKMNLIEQIHFLLTCSLVQDWLVHVVD